MSIYKKMKSDFYTFVFRKSKEYWVSLCLENGLVGQGITKDIAIQKLKDAIDSFNEVCETEEDIYNSSISIKELHEFLTVEEKEPYPEIYELRTVKAAYA